MSRLILAREKHLFLTRFVWIRMPKMRSHEKQENFLEHGRFGEDAQSMASAKVDQLISTIGLLFLVAAGALLVVASEIGKKVVPFFVYGFIVASAIGVVLVIWGNFRMRS